MYMYMTRTQVSVQISYTRMMSAMADPEHEMHVFEKTKQNMEFDLLFSISFLCFFIFLLPIVMLCHVIWQTWSF